MTLRNMFDGLATENTLKRLLTNLHFARDASDQMRVVVANTAGTQLNSTVLWNAGTYALWYATGAGNSIEQRELLKAQARANAQQARATRWTYT